MLYGEINRQRMKIINEHVVADTIDYLEARFAFSEDWDGLEKWAHFAKDGEVYDIRLTDDCVRKEDHLNLSAGIWKVYLHGNEFAGGKVIERITTNAAILKVAPTGTLDGEPFPEMPASVTEQILARLEKVEQNGGGGSGGGISHETDPTVPSWAKEPEKPTYTAEEVGALPADTRIPKKTSDLENDSGYITISVATLLNYYLKTEVYAKTEAYNREEVDSLISGLSKRLNAVADSTDVDLDQLSEIVAYIKSNKSLIDSITTSKVSVADIIDNLTTADSKKPLSAAQGKALKAMYDALPAWAKAANKPTYSKSEVGLGNVDNVQQYSASNPPPYPVTSVNGMTGAVLLNANHVRARPETWMPSASEVGADPSGTADSKVSAHNVSETSHNDIRLLITGLTNRLNALANSTDDDLDQLAEIVAYIKANKSLIDGITTSKVGVVDIIDNLTTNASNKPLSAKMGVQLKALIDAIKIPTSLPASDVYAWAKEPQKPTYTASEVGAATQKQVDDLSETIADLLPKNQGASNAGKILVVGTDGNLVLTDMPGGGAGDVTGVIDENNNILLSGNIADGTYVLKYANADGTYTDVGTLVVGQTKPSWTNFADPASADWKTGVRLTSNINETTSLSGGVATNYISVQTGDTVEVTGINIADSNSRTAYDFGGDYANILKPTALAGSNSLSDVSYDENGIICTIAAPQSDSMQIRFSGLLTGTSEDVVIKIKRNGEYL